MAAAAAGRGHLRLGLVLERPNLDGASAGDGRLARPLQRGVEIGGLDDPEAAELLLGLGERAVGDRWSRRFER